MADQKISELSEMAVAPAGGDLLAIVDVDVAQTKKITADNLIGARDMLPKADITYDIGSESLRWKDVFAQSMRAVSGEVDVNITNEPAGGFQGSIFTRQVAFAGSTSQVNIDVGVGGGDEPGIVSAFTSTDNAGDSSIVAVETSQGSSVFGSALCQYGTAGGSALVRSRGYSNFTTGHADSRYDHTTQLLNDGDASFLFGRASGYYGGSSTIQTERSARTQGSFAGGMSYSISYYGGGTAVVEANSSGQFVVGFAFNYGDEPGAAKIGGGEGPNAARGQFVSGSVFNSQADLLCIIEGGAGGGSFSQGYASASGVGSGCIITGSGRGAFAQGYARSIYGNGLSAIRASGYGSMARGYAYDGYSITASGLGSMAMGSANNGDISATAEAAVQLGIGTNSLANSMQIGNAGLRFKGTSGAPGAPQNGDFWRASSYTYVQSDGVAVPLTTGFSEVVSIDAIRTFGLTDKGKTIVLTGSTERDWTIPANATVPFAIGTLIAGESLSSANIIVGIDLDTLRSSADNSTGAQSIAPGGAFVLEKVATTEWKIAGSQMTKEPDTVNVTNVTVQESSAAPTLGDKEAGYEVLDSGVVHSITNPDNGAGAPTFTQLNSLTDWIDNKSYTDTYHARMTQDSGDLLGASSSPLNSWREIGVDSALWILESSNGEGFQQFVGTIAISDDGGSTTLDSATITLETNEV